MKNYKKEITKEYYNQSDYYQSHEQIFLDSNSRFQKYRLNKVLEIYSPEVGERVLDLGCAWGTFSFALAPRCKEVVGVDFSQKSIDLCNKLKKKYNAQNTRFICADAKATGLNSNSFDTVIAADFFEHIYPDESRAIMNECARVLRVGGKLVIWTPHRGHFFEILKNHNIILKKDISHVDYKSMEGLIRELNNSGFRIRKQYYVESHFPMIQNVEKVFMKFLPFFRRRIAILAEKIK